jgi:hypothetical protein
MFFDHRRERFWAVRESLISEPERAAEDVSALAIDYCEPILRDWGPPIELMAAELTTRSGLFA